MNNMQFGSDLDEGIRCFSRKTLFSQIQPLLSHPFGLLLFKVMKRKYWPLVLWTTTFTFQWELIQVLRELKQSGDIFSISTEVWCKNIQQQEEERWYAQPCIPSRGKSILLSFEDALLEMFLQMELNSRRGIGRGSWGWIESEFKTDVLLVKSHSISCEYMINRTYWLNYHHDNQMESQIVFEGFSFLFPDSASVHYIFRAPVSISLFLRPFLQLSS